MFITLKSQSGLQCLVSVYNDGIQFWIFLSCFEEKITHNIKSTPQHSEDQESL